MRKGKLKADPRQIHITNRKKMDGADPKSGSSATCSAMSAPLMASKAMSDGGDRETNGEAGGGTGTPPENH